MDHIGGLLFFTFIPILFSLFEEIASFTLCFSNRSKVFSRGSRIELIM